MYQKKKRRKSGAGEKGGRKERLRLDEIFKGGREGGREGGKEGGREGERLTSVVACRGGMEREGR
jgi:hypothetical protein